MRTRQLLARLFVLGLVAGTSREALARGDVRPDSASLPMTERPPEVRLGHELGLPDVTLRRHPLGSYGMTLVTYPDPLPTSHSDAPRLRGSSWSAEGRRFVGVAKRSSSPSASRFLSGSGHASI